jgi:RHS repeat-associated protein
VLDERLYYVHNWRNDVVAVLTDTGAQVESVRYSAYGIPFGSRAGDTDNDGDVNASSSTDDTDQIQTWISTSTYDVRGDLDLNGVVNIDDLLAALANAGTVTGWKDLTSDDVGNLKGYAGYEFDNTIQRHWSTWHVRHRVLTSNLGRWLQRDPLIALTHEHYGYTFGDPIPHTDPTGEAVPLLVYGGVLLLGGLFATGAVLTVALATHNAPGLGIDPIALPRIEIRMPAIPKAVPLPPPMNPCQVIFEGCIASIDGKHEFCCHDEPPDLQMMCFMAHWGMFELECATIWAQCMFGNPIPTPVFPCEPNWLATP